MQDNKIYMCFTMLFLKGGTQLLEVRSALGTYCLHLLTFFWGKLLQYQKI